LLGFKKNFHESAIRSTIVGPFPGAKVLPLSRCESASTNGIAFAKRLSSKGRNAMIDGAFVGLAVNRTAIEAAVRPTDEQWTTDVNDAGICEAAKRLTELHPRLVVMEAHGGLELPVAGTLAAAGLPFALVSPQSIRDFAKAIGRGGNRGHAELLAQFAELVRPEVRILPGELLQQLEELRWRRQEVLTMLELERNRQGRDSLLVQKDIRNHIYFLQKSVIALGEEINRTIRISYIWR
jgi:transposase